ncbi:unnamed protein product [Durusdinium trenchii]|uniref:Amine oxidase n=2 Tax=Durusdinium trenchii TaxID=1381693 RepID=A0ABP0MHR1_9DINO
MPLARAPRHGVRLLAALAAMRSLTFVDVWPQMSSRSLVARSALTKEEQKVVNEWRERDEVMTLEEAKKKATGKFAIPPEELIQRAMLYLAKNQYGVEDPNDLADDFLFVGQVIGPLEKDEFIKTLGQFDLKVAFPDQKVRWHDFRVDPYEPSRVWFTARSMGTNLGAIPPLIPEATNKAFESPPEACSLRFNEQGQVVEYTAGYVIDRRQGNTGGRGGLLGPLYAIGKGFPFPEAQPYDAWDRRQST